MLLKKSKWVMKSLWKDKWFLFKCIYSGPLATKGECHLVPLHLGEAKHLYSWYLQNWTTHNQNNLCALHYKTEEKQGELSL